MKISFFKSITNTSPFVSKDVNHFLDRIKEGKSRKLVEAIRLEPDKDKQNEIKRQLPVVCFGGHFSSRSKKGLKKSSGLMVIDFDDFQTEQEAKEFKEKLKEDKHIFSAWLSPRIGVKALYRIQNVQNDEEYKNIFLAVKSIYPTLDDSGKDISRACFESYDPSIYVNLEAEVYVPPVQEMVQDHEINEIGQLTNIPLRDQDVIANRLLKWFNGHYDRSQRNNSVFKLAVAFNDFGVDKSTATIYCNRYAEKGFSVNEISKIIESAYKNTANFGTKHFEDAVRRKRLTNMVLTGKKLKTISKEFGDVNLEQLEEEVKIIKDTVNVEEFWTYDHQGKVKIDHYKFKLYLESLNYRKYYPAGNDKTFVFIGVDSNLVDDVNEFQIKDRIMNNLLVNDEVDVFNLCADKTKLFKQDYLSMIETAEIDTEKDGKDYALLYFQNKVVKVFKDKTIQLSYDDIEGYIWRNQIMDRDYIEADHHESMFRTFVWKIAGEETDRYNTLKSVIGYALHSYKNSSDNKAIILNDEMISDTPNGGSGKGLLTQALGKIKKLSSIDGKIFDFSSQFPYQTVSTECQLLAFDDVKKNFDFEKLFSLITEGITIEYKGQDAVKIPVADSPKVIISTNYTIKAEGGSFERRMFEVELSSYFGAAHSPRDEFGCMFFDDWDDKEWARFDQYMINCLQYYLKNGLMTYEQKNLKLRKLINQTAFEFVEYMDSKKYYMGQRINYKTEKEEFIASYEDFAKWLQQRMFNKWIKSYLDFKGYESKSIVSNGIRMYEITDGAPMIGDEDKELTDMVEGDVPF